jgi:hypothetical protein
MRCTACHGPVAFERTVFHGTAPTTIRLCAVCATQADVLAHLEAIKAATDHPTKDAAVVRLLKAVEETEAEGATRRA